MGIASLFKSMQLPKFVIQVSIDLVGVSCETGSTPQKYHKSFRIYSLLELANNKFGFINSQHIIYSLSRYIGFY